MSEKDQSGEHSAPSSLLPATNDLVFRALFTKASNRDLLISMLNGVLELTGDKRIEEVQILSPLPELEMAHDKEGVVDLLVRDGQGRRYIIEMQVRHHDAFAERCVYYLARRYGEQLRSGEAYGQLCPIVLLVFTDFVMMPGYTHWCERYELRGAANPTVFSNHLAIVLVELPKFKKRPAEATTLGEQWVSFLKEGNTMNPSTAEPWLTPELRKAREELVRLSADPQMRDAYEARLRQISLHSTELQAAFREGMEEGMEEGIEKVARNLLSEGESPERVARFTGLSPDRVRALQPTPRD